jgi:SAM-dependent methyltransferase
VVAGGAIWTIQQVYPPLSITGLDISFEAIAYDRRAHRDPRITVHEGDAEKRPFESQSFDVVTNVESSHVYPSVHAFYVEVHRGLVPGGCFLYTDMLPVAQLQQNLAVVMFLGFRIVRDRDITSDVMLSCDQLARNRIGACSRGMPRT